MSGNQRDHGNVFGKVTGITVRSAHVAATRAIAAASGALSVRFKYVATSIFNSRKTYTPGTSRFENMVVSTVPQITPWTPHRAVKKQLSGRFTTDPARAARAITLTLLRPIAI